MNDRVPEAIRPLLHSYVKRLQHALPDGITTIYLHGSIALGAFDDSRSDIDTLVVLSRPATIQDLQALAALHQALAKAFPRWLLEVSYIQIADLGQAEEKIAPHPIHHDNHLMPDGKFDTNPVTWWILKHKGIALVGADPQSLPYIQEWDTLRTYIHRNMNRYWATYDTHLSRKLTLFMDTGIAWMVLGVLRQYYTLREQEITSKVGAGEYALQHLPADWHPLIHDALDIRQGRRPSRYASRFTRARAALRFLRYIITESKRLT